MFFQIIRTHLQHMRDNNELLLFSCVEHVKDNYLYKDTLVVGVVFVLFCFSNEVPQAEWFKQPEFA